MTRVTLIAAILVIVVGLTMVRAQGLEWTLVNWKVRHDFPNVPRISTAQLHEWLNDPGREKPRLEPGSDVKGLNLPRDKPIVTYCSVGYRSAAFARKLQEAGYKSVQNTAGSIFEWANKGYPLESNGAPVLKVHPYNTRWGRLLKAPLRADEPPAGSGM